jgi:hypothetical protein
VQVAGHVFVDLDAVAQQLVIQRTRGVVLHAVLDLALQQEAHAHAARRCLGQRAADLAAGEEVGVGDQDVAARMRDAVQVGALEGLAKAQVVAQHQRGAQVATGRHGSVARLEQPHAVPVARMTAQARPVQPHPQQFLGIGGLGDQRPLHLHGEIEARPGDAVRRIAVIVVVDDVDAADEGDAPVDHSDLAVQAAQPAARRNVAREPARLGTEDAALRAGVGQARTQGIDELCAAEAVEHHAHLDSAPHGRLQAVQYLGTGAVRGEDVGFQVHADLGGVDGRAQRRKEVGAVLEQPDVVAHRPVQLGLLCPHGSSSSASKGE